MPVQRSLTAVIIGAGPGGLMAAEQLANQQIPVTVFDAMPSVGRKLLRAGIGGLNITHSESKSAFVQRYNPQAMVEHWLNRFDADNLVQWVNALGIETFVGSSGRVFPNQKKAAPLLRTWIKRLKASGVTIATHHRWQGWDEDGRLKFVSPQGDLLVEAGVVIFALGGGSWQRLGSDGRWVSEFVKQGIACNSLRPSNCGFNYAWSESFKAEQQGLPLKNVSLMIENQTKKGDATLSHYGIEGGLVYGLSANIREQVDSAGQALIYWDLLPDQPLEALRSKLQKRRAKDSVSNVLRKHFALSGSKLALLRELSSKAQMQNLDDLPHLIKHLPQVINSYRPIDEAISTAGGVAFTALSEELMLKIKPGTFCVGEMLDWDAPTGGYLLTACFASGVVAGEAAVKYLANRGL